MFKCYYIIRIIWLSNVDILYVCVVTGNRLHFRKKNNKHVQNNLYSSYYQLSSLALLTNINVDYDNLFTVIICVT